jgi:hypothetical protein
MLDVFPSSSSSSSIFIDLNARSRHRLCRVLAETEFIGACLPCIAPVHHSRAKVDALQLVAQKRSDGGSSARGTTEDPSSIALAKEDSIFTTA